MEAECRSVRNKIQQSVPDLHASNSGSTSDRLDALSVDWDGLDAYAFPPAVLITKVLQEFRQSNCRVILIAPLWCYFQQWCISHKIQPEAIDIPQIADFLLFLRDIRKLRAGTIAGYLSVIATVRNVATNTKLALVPELSAIIRGFKQADMRRRFRPPAWDLNLVLTDLTKSPYEPIR